LATSPVDPDGSGLCRWALEPRRTKSLQMVSGGVNLFWRGFDVPRQVGWLRVRILSLGPAFVFHCWLSVAGDREHLHFEFAP
jgi:hypothetical protein